MRATHLVGALLTVAILFGATGVVIYAFGRRPAPRQLPPDRSHPVVYVALGDSTVYGVGASRPVSNYVSRLYERLRSMYPGVRLVNLGVSGATAADVMRAQLGRAVALRPDLVTLSIGPNDITRERDVRQYERNIETILRALTHQTTATIVVNLIPDLTVTLGSGLRPLGAADVARGRGSNSTLTKAARHADCHCITRNSISPTCGPCTGSRPRSKVSNG
ncbi:MAG: SGNH/GDSL hydrolase family protein [Armatimonadota bacterium]